MEFIHNAAQWLVSLVSGWGYWGVVFLMFLESSFLPVVPSELVMPPAGYCASDAVGTMNLYLAILMGTIGSCLGALLNYYLAAWLGRPFFLKYGKYFFCPPHKLEKIDKFFSAHGEISTFTGRLLPGIRHYISLSAGLTHMKMFHFIFYTALGAGIWCAILTVIGYLLGENRALMMTYSKRAGIWVIIGCVLIVGIYIWNHRRKKAQQTESNLREP